ncbi:MAG: hypothetical protein CSA49_05435 [Gammaproteobacteria bacterium]|nr:MAG: hypothetical protein CSA49_05435 [Gammaproteobacteria bacterium]
MPQTSKQKVYLFFMLLVIAAHLPFQNIPISSDDYMQYVTLTGSQQLSQEGLTFLDKNTSFLEKINNSFHFFNSKTGTAEQLRNYGNLPWWSSETGSMQPYRPLAGLTHWIDYNLLNANTFLMQLHNLLYFLLFSMVTLFFFLNFTTNHKVAVITTLLIVFDISMSINLGFYSSRNTYIALSLALLSLHFYSSWRSKEIRTHFIYALLLFAGALLTAEAAVALSAYFGAYAFTMDKRGWKKGLVATLPFAILVICWRILYNLGGYGAEDIGLYLDPGRDLLAFCSHLLLLFPLICFSLISAMDGIGGNLRPDLLPYVSVALWIILIALLVFAGQHIKNHPKRRMMLFGALMAVVPHCALVTAGNRSGTFVAIGGFYLLATSIIFLIDKQRSKAKRTVGYMIGGYHIAIPVLAITLLSWGLIPIPVHDNRSYSSIEESHQSLKNKHLVILNHFSSADLLVAPYKWDYEGKPTPEKVQAMAPGLSSLQIKRLTTNEYLITGKTVLNQTNPMLSLSGEQPAQSRYYTFHTLQGLVTAPDTQYIPGQMITSADMLINILSTIDGVVHEYKVTFLDKIPADEKVWQRYDWQEKEFKTIAPLEIGETLFLPGPLDI